MDIIYSCERAHYQKKFTFIYHKCFQYDHLASYSSHPFNSKFKNINFKSKLAISYSECHKTKHHMIECK